MALDRPWLPLALGSALLLTGVFSPARGQDDALKKLLEKLEPQAPAPKADEKKPAEARQTEEKNPRADSDKALDSLLEKLGGGRDETPEARGNAPAELGPQLPGQKPGSGQVGKEDESLDEHLERLLGRIKKQKDPNQQEGGQDEKQEGGRLSETVKKMREVEQRLTKLDTGEDTRKRQGEIVGDLEQLLKTIQQIRQQQQQQQAQAQVPGQRQGQQPGQRPGQQSGENAGGAPPVDPKIPSGLAGAKDTWGHLPGTLREVMENVSRMQPLPERKELVERYFLSVAKRSLSRSGGE